MFSSGDNNFSAGSDYEASLRWQLEQAEQFLACKVTNCFKDKSAVDIKAIIQYDSTEVLEWLMEIALEAERYEICAAVQQIRDERKLVHLA